MIDSKIAGTEETNFFYFVSIILACISFCHWLQIFSKKVNNSIFEIAFDIRLEKDHKNIIDLPLFKNSFFGLLVKGLFFTIIR